MYKTIHGQEALKTRNSLKACEIKTDEVKIPTVSKNLLSHVGHHSDLGKPRDQGIFATAL